MRPRGTLILARAQVTIPALKHASAKPKLRREKVIDPGFNKDKAACDDLDCNCNGLIVRRGPIVSICWHLSLREVMRLRMLPVAADKRLRRLS